MHTTITQTVAGKSNAFQSYAWKFIFCYLYILLKMLVGRGKIFPRAALTKSRNIEILAVPARTCCLLSCICDLRPTPSPRWKNIRSTQMRPPPQECIGPVPYMPHKISFVVQEGSKIETWAICLPPKHPRSLFVNSHIIWKKNTFS